MKTPLIVLAVGISAPLIAQKIESKDVPTSAKKSLQKNFGVTDATWQKEKQDYEADFKMQGKKASAVFNSDGIILGTEITVATSDLPAKAKSVLEKEYAGYAVEEVEKVTTKGVIGYEVKVEKKEKAFELKFDADGRFLTMEEEDEKE